MGSMLVVQPEIETERLRLRRLRARDAGLIALYASDRRVAGATTTIPHPYPPGAADAFVERMLSAGTPERTWALDAGAEYENGLIGLISLKPRGEGVAEIGYWVAPAYWNTGYASEAVNGLVAHAAAAGWRELAAEVIQDNAPSARVLVHAGFEYVGEGELYAPARGAMVPTFRYRRLLAEAA